MKICLINFSKSCDGNLKISLPWPKKSYFRKINECMVSPLSKNKERLHISTDRPHRHPGRPQRPMRRDHTHTAWVGRSRHLVEGADNDFIYLTNKHSTVILRNKEDIQSLKVKSDTKSSVQICRWWLNFLLLSETTPLAQELMQTLGATMEVGDDWPGRGPARG